MTWIDHRVELPERDEFYCINDMICEKSKELTAVAYMGVS